MLGKFGSVTTAVVGHLKTICILIAGFWVHRPAMDLNFLKMIVGVCIAMTGVVKYGQYTQFPDADWSISGKGALKIGAVFSAGVVLLPLGLMMIGVAPSLEEAGGYMGIYR